VEQLRITSCEPVTAVVGAKRLTCTCTFRDRRLGPLVLPTASSYVDMFDDEHNLLPEVEHPAFGAIRVPDGRTLAWAEYGSARGVPCVLIPDLGSSRLAPVWLLHDSALPSAVRLLALDRPGTGASDPIGLGGREDPAEDLRRLVDTLAVGRVAVIGIGHGVEDAFTFAGRYPRLVASVTAVSSRLSEPAAGRRRLRHPFSGRASREIGGVVGGWLAAIGDGDVTLESTWIKALSRMNPAARTSLGDRWKEADFRSALAADLAQTQKTWGTESRPAPAGSWILHPPANGVPVHVWHGQDEGGTALSDVRSAVGNRPGWEVTGVSSSTAVLGAWPQILSTAATSFGAASAA
jgi:pimeloyl-ACP methyl ester carboxylesterase